jgi:hypothetical protein
MATYRHPYFRLNAWQEQEPVIPSGLTELRTHGVNGAPPEQLLNDPHPILVSGDDTAAFYRSREKPAGDLERTVEAYSWTGLNSRAGSRAFWLLLFPFAMVNFAGWLIPDPWPLARLRIPLTRALIRLLGVAFTLHYTLWTMVMAVDLLALQCGQLTACYQQRWLGWFNAINRAVGGNAAHRMVVFAAVPLLLVGGLWLLGQRNGRRYDQYWASTDCDPEVDRGGHCRVDDLPLHRPDFWRTPHFVQVQALLHASAAVAAVGAALAWALSCIGSSPSRNDTLRDLGLGAVVMVGVATAATVATGWLRHQPSQGRNPYRRTQLAARLLLAVSLCLAGWVGWLGWSTPVKLVAPLPGLRAAFDGVLAVEFAVLLALYLLVESRLFISTLVAGGLLYQALEWDQPQPRWPLWMLIAVVVAVVAIAVYAARAAGDRGAPDPLRHLYNPFWIFVGLAAVMLVTVLGWRAQEATWPNRLVISIVPVAYLLGAFFIQIRHGHDYPPSWRLRGGGLAAVAAVGSIALTMVSAAAIVFFADRLGKAVARMPGDEVAVARGQDQISYPGELGWIAAAGLAALIIFLLALSTRIGSLWWFRWRRQRSQIHAEFERQARPHDPEQIDLEPGDRPRLARRAAWARLFGGLVDDADWLVSAAVVAMLAGVVSLIRDLSEPEPELPSQGLGQIIGFSSWALGGVALGAIWLIRTARNDTGLRRAVGIIWEVASFFPRRFHPLAPPSYAERSVPELRGRLIDLTARGRVLLVAHSQGTLISAAALLTLLGDPTCRPHIRRIAWITFGCMLRRLFGRAYPHVVRRADLAALKTELEHREAAEGNDFPEPDVGRPPYWMNFGRHSDYLGGRVFTEHQLPPPYRSPDRYDDVFFGDPTRRWRFRGQTQQARLWRHSFDYLDDAEDSRFANHVGRLVRHLRDSAPPP